MIRKKVVLTKNYDQFLNFCREAKLNPKDVIYANSLQKIKGLRNCEVIYAGIYWESPLYKHPYLREIERAE